MMERTRWLASIALALGMAACDPPPPADPPDAPSVDAVPTLTNQSPLTLTGTAEAGALVQVRGGASSPVEATAGDDGSFSVDVELNADSLNTLLVSQTVEEAESESVTVTVTHDGTPPGTPALSPVVSPTRRSSQRIRGTTEANATVTITGGADEATGTADASGAFEVLVMLETTETGTVDNELSVVARDEAGNDSAPATATITFDPSIAIEAPVLDDFPSYTSATTVTLSGEAEAGVGISAVGGATDGMTTVADDGTFSVDVGLRPNQRNMILVFAVAGGETSVAAVAIIHHDDVAPEAPNVDPQASPTGAEVITLTGTAEPGATIDVAGGAAAASALVEESGAFSLDVMLTADADNELSVTATDLAGNESAATTLSVTHDGSLEDPIRVDPVTSPTRNATVTLSGTATPDIDVEITGGAATATTRSDAGDGSWSADVMLNPNARNELRITRPGSGADTIVVIVHDDTPPSAPTLNTIASPTSATVVAVSGTSEPLASLSVTGGVASASGAAEADGRFSIDVTIATDTETTLSVIATDRAGNSSTASTVSVTHSSDVPEAPIVDQPNPPPTNMAMHTVTGRVVSPGVGITIRITGGSAAATGPTDESSGVFSIPVTLNANAVNTLNVIAVTGTIESSPTIVTITHDDMPPAAPDSSRITASAGTCIVLPVSGNVSGTMSSVEARSTVRVQNVTRSSNRTATATDGGAFTVSIPSCAGDIIRITAEDAAGNVSDFVEVNAS